MSRDRLLEAQGEDTRHRTKPKHTSEGGKKKKRKHDLVDVASPDVPSPKKSRHREKETPLNGVSYADSTGCSPFYIQSASVYLSIPPISLQYATQGLCSEVLSSLILKYYPPLRGVILAYSNVKISEDPGHPTDNRPFLAISVHEYAASFIWTTADFLVFRPRKGDHVEGWINLQNEGHIGLICWNLFNVRIGRACLPASWKWIEPTMRKPRSKAKLKHDGIDSQFSTNGAMEAGDNPDYQGHYEDENGTPVSGKISFTVEDVEASSSGDHERSYLIVEGTMLKDGLDAVDGTSNRLLDSYAFQKRKRRKVGEVS